MLETEMKSWSTRPFIATQSEKKEAQLSPAMTAKVGKQAVLGPI